MTAEITGESALFDALMAREDLFDALVELDGGFAKFYRVLVSEGTARRLSLNDTAAMLGIRPEGLITLAKGSDPGTLARSEAPQDRADVLEVPCASVIDTQPIFEKGEEPLPALLYAADALPSGESLLVKAPFHPVPLRRLLALRAFMSLARQNGDGWEVFFARLPEA